TGDLARYLPDGRLEVFGRRDHQIKLRGIRVEPEEIETVLAEHPEILETAVVPRDWGGRRRGAVQPRPRPRSPDPAGTSR
ncbi:MAG: amino acid adenylation domain-containing protein, partial [bacterium]|nr:amino acid adenylation domain-containing protein [bacterium]